MYLCQGLRRIEEERWDRVEKEREKSREPRGGSNNGVGERGRRKMMKP